MSKFKTSVVVSTAEITKALPPGSYLAGILWNADDSKIEVLWDNDDFKTPFDHAVEFPRETLLGGKVPAGVTVKKRPDVHRRDAETQSGDGAGEPTAAAPVAEPGDVRTEAEKTVVPKRKAK